MGLLEGDGEVVQDAWLGLGLGVRVRVRVGVRVRIRCRVRVRVRVVQDAEDVLGLGLGVLGIVGLELVDRRLRLGVHGGERLDLGARLVRIRMRVRVRGMV